MPEVGDTLSGKVLGKPGNKYIWAACPDCKVERWALYSAVTPSSNRRCKPCHIKHTRGQFRLKGSNE
jgi:hypothetical protein